MTEFYITFGNKYRLEAHPAGEWVHPDGYLVIEATDYSTARQRAFELLGDQFAFIYAWPPSAYLYPLGALKRIKA